MTGARLTIAITIYSSIVAPVLLVVLHSWMVPTTLSRADDPALIVYRMRTALDGVSAPLIMHKYIFCLVSQRWKNAIKDVHANPDMQFDTDHFLVTAKTRIKLKEKRKEDDNEEKVIR